MILFKDFFKVEHPELTKVKFNMNFNDEKKTTAWQLLQDNDERWLEMNEHRKKQPNNNYGDAKYLIALAQYPDYGPMYYIFGGYYSIETIKPDIFDGRGYKITKLPQFQEYEKRLILKLKKPIGRDLYNRKYENIDDLGLEVYEVSSTPKMETFNGYNNVRLTHPNLVRIMESKEPEWENALKYVKGIYVITDKNTGKLYIGKASGSDGIWGRWSSYAKGLTGGNKDFEEIKHWTSSKGEAYIRDNFQYSILEIFDTKVKEEEILHREQYWMSVFQTKTHGMNN